MRLPELSRADRLLLSIVLIGAILVAILTWLVLPPEKTGGMERQPSTFYNVGYGTKAGYQVLDRLGYPVTQLRRRIERETLRDIGVLFVLQPEIGLDRHEVAVLEDWVKQGHALVVVPGQSGRFMLFGSDLAEWFDFETVAGAEEEEKVRVDLRAVHPASNWQPDVGEPLTSGIGELVTQGRRRFTADSPLLGPLARMPVRTFWRDKFGTVGLRVEFGDGAVVALADTYPLTNFGISEADNGLLLANLIRDLSENYPGQVAFDEYHLGFPQRETSPVAIARLVLTGEWRWAVAQAVLVCVLALYAKTVRFGKPLDVTLKRRRQHREFAEAAGRLLDEAGATSLAAETLCRHYRDRLCRLVDLEPQADNLALSRAVLARSGQDVAVILEQAQTAAARPVSRQRLLSITRTLHHLVETLDHGT